MLSIHKSRIMHKFDLELKFKLKHQSSKGKYRTEFQKPSNIWINI